MNRFYKTGMAALLISYLPQLSNAAMEENPLLYNIMIGELETNDSNNNFTSWDAQGWLGRNFNKLWFKTEGERSHGQTEQVEIQALYSRAISPFWDFQAGIRHDAKPTLDHNWAVIGMQGIARYFFELDTALFIGESGNTAFRFNAEYELLFTQKLILTPEVEMNFYGQNMPAIGIGSGLSDLNLGLRLRYEIRREFAPYIGINWWEKYGGTADYTELLGEDITDTEFVFGIRLWF